MPVLPLPETSSPKPSVGVAVPMPTRPFEVTTKAVEVAEEVEVEIRKRSEVLLKWPAR